MFTALQRQIMELNNQQEKRWNNIEQVRKSDKKAMEVRMREMMEQADKTQTLRSRHSIETWRQGIQEITGQATALSLPTSRASRQLEDESMDRRDTRGPKLATPTPFTGKAVELPNFLFTVREYCYEPCRRIRIPSPCSLFTHVPVHLRDPARQDPPRLRFASI